MAYQSKAREYLARLVRTREEVSDWLASRAFPFAKYDPELGYIHQDRRFKEGTEDSICTYTYDTSGARHTIMHADRPCRINSYGDSVTNCEQVTDGESWQEVLAAFLGEPIRNYGVGGYSVYQAFLRMKREERLYPAKYIILTITDPDHLWNLISWQEITNGKNWQHFQPPVPYVIANPATGQFEEIPNPCPTPESLYNLCNMDWVYERFKDDFVLKVQLAQEAGKEQHSNPAVVQMVHLLASQHGMHSRLNYSGGDLIKTADSIYTRAGIYATTRIVDQIEKFAAEHNKKVLYVLYYSDITIAKRLRREKRFDQSFIDFMQARKLPYVDLLEIHAADYANFNPDLKSYLGRYYNDHAHPKPRGYFFFAFAILSKLVSMLDPKPAPFSGFYDCSSGINRYHA